MATVKSKKIIAIDIDDVLSDNARAFVEFSNEKWGTSLNVDDYCEDWAKMWQVDIDEMERRADVFHSSGIIAKYNHDVSAKLVLQKLKENFDLVIVTSRRDQIKEATVCWVRERYPDLFKEEAIYFSGIWDKKYDRNSIYYTKAEICKLLDVDYLIDDQLKHCVAVAECGIKPLLFGNYAWNQPDDLSKNIDRATNWAEVLDYFNEEISTK